MKTLQILSNIFPVRITSKAILFLDKKQPFAGINRNGVWFQCSRLDDGKLWYNYADDKILNRLGILHLKYSERCDLAVDIARTYLKPSV